MSSTSPELNEVTKGIIRSLCSETPQEKTAAQENYLNTDFKTLEFSGIFSKILKLVEDFYRLYGGPPQTEVLADYAERRGEQEVALVVREIGVLPRRFGSGYNEIIAQFIELSASLRLKILLAEAGQIAEDGFKQGKLELRGVPDALSHLVSGSVEIQQAGAKRNRVISTDNASEVMSGRHYRKKEDANVLGAATGIINIDQPTRGGHAGELWLIGGYAKHGKTTFATNWCRFVATEGGWNVYYVTLEVPAHDVWDVLYASHSANPKWGRPPLLHTEVSSSRFNSAENERFYFEVMRDFESADFGRIEVDHPSDRTTIESIWGRAETINQINPLDMIVIDYLSLLDPKKGMERFSSHDVITQNIKDAKRMALDFDRGKGILVVVPHQLSREGYKEAQKNGGVYSTYAFADTAEAERSSDVLLTIYRDNELAENQEAVMCLLCNRKGELVEPFRVYAPFEYRYLSNLRGATKTTQLIG